MKNAVFWDLKPSSYLTRDTLRLRYRTQPVKAIYDLRTLWRRLRGVLSPRILHHVALVRKKCITSIIRVTAGGKLGGTLAITRN
jgi:hypothetical protein